MYVVHCCRDLLLLLLLLLLWSSSSCCWLLCNGARCGSGSSSSSATTTDVFTSSYYTGLFFHHTNRGLCFAIVVVVLVVSVDVAAADNDAGNDVDDDAAIVLWCFKSFSAVAGGFVNDFEIIFLVCFSLVLVLWLGQFFMLLWLFCLLHVCCCSWSSSSHFWGVILVFFSISGIQSKIRGIYLVLHSLCACFVFFSRDFFFGFFWLCCFVSVLLWCWATAAAFVVFV